MNLINKKINGKSKKKKTMPYIMIEFGSYQICTPFQCEKCTSIASELLLDV